MTRLLFKLTLLAVSMFTSQLAWAQSVIRIDPVSVSLDGQMAKLEESCGGEALAFSGNLRFTGTVSHDANGGMDVELQAQHDQIGAKGLVSGTEYRGESSGVIRYHSNERLALEWMEVDNFNLVKSDGQKSLAAHASIVYSVDAGGTFNAKLSGLSLDCEAH